jgi:hypothetical protein
VVVVGENEVLAGINKMGLFAPTCQVRGHQ